MYNNLGDAFAFRLDERVVCCLVYFLGPMDTKTLQLISNILKLATLKVSINIKDLISFITEGALTAILGMLASYVSQIMDKVVNRIMKLFNSVPDTDLQAAIKLCAGIDFLFKIFGMSVDAVIDFMLDIVGNLNAIIQSSFNKTTAGASIYTERKIIITLAALLDAIIQKFESVQDMCVTPESGDSEDVDQVAADAAVNFVVKDLPKMYPVLDLSEGVRRKYFKNTGGFTSRNLGIAIPGFDSAGNPGTFENPETAVADCAQNSSATRSSIIAQRIISAFKDVK